MSKAIAVEEAFNGVGRSRSRVIEDSTDFTQFHPLDVREENWIRATVIYRVLRTAHLFSKREGGEEEEEGFRNTSLSRLHHPPPPGWPAVKSAGEIAGGKCQLPGNN